MPSPSNPRKCLHCRSVFLADRRNLRHQAYCSQPACRRESKRQAQKRWLSKPENRNHFKGDAHVARVRRWRAAHPGYSKNRKPRTVLALQDLCTPQVPPIEPVVVPDPQDLFAHALQDLCKQQLPLVVGLIAQTLGSPLQDDIVQHAAKLIAKGQDLLDLPSRRLKSKIPGYGSQTSPPPRAASQNPHPVQLAGSSTHSAGPAP